MKKILLAAAIAFALTGCASMPEKVCDATYESGGMEYGVSIFGTAIQGERLLLRPGYPFSFHYVDESNFKSHNCSG